MSGASRRGPGAPDEVGTFWSRRRAAVAAEAEAELQAETEATEAALRAEVEEAAAEKTDEEILAELGLKAPEEMQAGDDFKAFLQTAVPDRLRRRALRVLWRSNPVLANLDALVDYGEDFTDSARVMENLQTAYQVGKGMLKHVEVMAAQAEAEAAAEAKAAAGEDPETEIPAEDVDIALAEDVVDEASSADAVLPDEAAQMAQTPVSVEADSLSYDESRGSPEALPEGPFIRRRMRFDYDAAPTNEKGAT